MKILLAHNYYRIRGGEDVVFESELELLRNNCHNVETFTVKSKEGMNALEKVQTALSGFSNHTIGRLFAEKIKTFNPDIIHVHNFFPLLSPIIFDIAANHKIPVVMTLHNFRLICPQAMFLRDGKVCTDCLHQTISWAGVKNKCYQNSTLATILNTAIISAAKFQGVWQHKIAKYIVLNPYVQELFEHSSLDIPSDKFALKPNSTADYGYSYEKEPFVLFVGRLSSEKGIELLLETFKQLPNIHLKIIGTGPLQSLVEEAATRNPNIEYLSVLPREGVMSWLKKASALIFSSIWLETFGLVISEAFSVGTPVIAPLLPTLEHFVKHNHNGLLYELGNSEHLAQVITQFFSQDVDRASLMKNARNDWQLLYSPDVGYKGLVSIYDEVIKTSS